ncbi:MAG: universal stress protein [Treponema sp.]|nr:universal stress protein [Treponema sp.]
MKGLLSNVIVLVNGAESSISAVKYAIALQRAYGSAVTAVYVVDTHTIRQLALSRIFVDDESEEYERSLAETGRRYLAFAGELARVKGATIERRLLSGSIAGEVVRAAEDLAADGIILGGWERGSVFRDLLAEENKEIARTARCSVLIVRGSAAEEAYRSL